RRNVPEMAGEYFELGTLPAYGLYARGIHGLSMRNVRFQVTEPDLRPAVVFTRVHDAAVSAFSAQGNAASELVRVVDSTDILVRGTGVVTPGGAFVRLEGPGSSNIKVEGGDLSKTKEPVTFGAGASKDAVRL